MKVIDVKAGQKQRIISQFSNSLRQTYQFSAQPLEEGGEVSGNVEIKGSNFLFPKPARMQYLQSENEVDKGMWDTIYNVYVTPDCDVRISVHSGQVQNLWVYLIIILLVLAFATALIF